MGGKSSQMLIFFLSETISAHREDWARGLGDSHFEYITDAHGLSKTTGPWLKQQDKAGQNTLYRVHLSCNT